MFNDSLGKNAYGNEIYPILCLTHIPGIAHLIVDAPPERVIKTWKFYDDYKMKVFDKPLALTTNSSNYAHAGNKNARSHSHPNEENPQQLRVWWIIKSHLVYLV